MYSTMSGAFVGIACRRSHVAPWLLADGAVATFKLDLLLTIAAAVLAHKFSLGPGGCMHEAS
jgi:hypothetical protein